MDNSFTVTLIRHLPTKGNLEKKYIGWTDEPIISGIKTVNSIVLKQVIGSDLLRCKQTANQLFGEIPYIENSNFRECSFGEWEERTYSELKEDINYRAWLDDFYQVAPPNGESLTQLETRVMEGFMEVVHDFDQPVIITHGGPIRVLLSQFVGEEKSFWNWDVPHGCCYKLQWAQKQDVLEGMQCRSFSVEHLMEKGSM